ncbi:MAG TPA: macro domain-containing protein [Myxococcota bacterium]|nr:macro domain-containing protein [Myxococcota bacterium]
MEKKVGKAEISLVTDDITLMDVDAFVFYARPDLKLGSGYGNAISVRGGTAIQEELDKIGSADVGEAVVTSAGKLRARHIIHAVGPAFQEQDSEIKLEKTTRSVIEKAEELEAGKLALPPMGSGFYGIAPDVCARVLLGVLGDHLSGETSLRHVYLCLPDGRDMTPFQKHLAALQPKGATR